MSGSVVDALKANYGLVISLITAFLINRLSHSFKYFPHFYPNNLRQSVDKYQKWKWRNFLISFIHAIVTGFGSLICILIRPTLLIYVIEEHLTMAYILTALSHGYFIYDLIEMLNNLQYKGSKELVLHHILILLCFSLTVIQHKYCGYSSIALLIELSNIFLHFRQLLIISNTSKASTVYKTICITNLVLFVLVRASCLVWLWVTLLWVLPRVPIIPKIIAFTTLISICCMTYVLFVRVYQSDFSAKKSNSDSLNAKSNVNNSTGAQTTGNVFNSNHLKTS